MLVWSNHIRLKAFGGRGIVIVIAKLRRQVHDDIYDALTSVETWEDNWELEALQAVAPVAEGLARLLALLLCSAASEAREAHNPEP